MPDQANIFNNEGKDTNSEPNKQPQGQDNQLADLLKQIVNVQGEQKYKTLEDGLNALKHSQEYIPQLKQELDALKAENENYKSQFEKMTTLESTVQELLQRRSDDRDPGNTLSQEDIQKVVNERLTQITHEQQTKAAQAAVAKALMDKFGQEAEKVFYEKGAEMGLSQDELNTLAGKSPKAVLALFGVSDQKAKPSNPGPSRSTFNSDGFAPKKDSFIGRNKTSVALGATSEQMNEAFRDSQRMVQELHEMGMDTHDLSDPKVYAKLFRQ